VDEHGYAAGHGHRPPPGAAAGSPPQPPGEKPPRVFSRRGSTSPSTGHPPGAGGGGRRLQPRSGAPPGDWELVPRAAGTWALILPGGRELAVRFDVGAQRHGCDHRPRGQRLRAGRAGLRRLVQVQGPRVHFSRPCSRPAKDFGLRACRPLRPRAEEPTHATAGGPPAGGANQVKQSRGVGGLHSPSQAGTCGRPRPAAPTRRNHGATSHKLRRDQR